MDIDLRKKYFEKLFVEILFYVTLRLILKTVKIMSSITLQYNPNNTLAMSIIRSIKSAGVFQIAEESSPYNKEFVEKIQESRKNKGVVIMTENLWK